MLEALKATLGGFLDGFAGSGLADYLTVPGEPVLGFAPPDAGVEDAEPVQSLDSISIALPAEAVAAWKGGDIELRIDPITRKIQIFPLHGIASWEPRLSLLGKEEIEFVKLLAKLEKHGA